MWEGPWFSCLKWKGHRDALTRNNAGFPCSDLNVGLSRISQDEGMSESPVETLEKALVPRLISTGGLTSLWQLERDASSMLQKETMPDYSWIYVGIPISLWQLERDPGSPASLWEAPLLPCQASRIIPRCPLQLDRSPDVAEQTRVLKGHLRRNSIKYPRFPPQLEKNHENSPSLRDEARFPCTEGRAILSSTSTRREPWLPWCHCRESPRTLSQV